MKDLPEKRPHKDDCFGLPHGGAIAGMILGLIIIIWGASILFDIPIWNNIFYIVVIIFGVLIVAGSIYKMTRR